MSASILDTIAAELGPSTLAQLGQSVGANPDQTRAAVAAALPALIGGLARNTASSDGAASLAAAVDRDHVGSLESQLQGFGGLLGGASGQPPGGGLGGMLGGILGSALSGGAQPAGASGGGGLGGMLGAAVSAMTAGNKPANAPKALDGIGILGHILGTRQPAVESGVAKASGLDASTIAKLLPALAPIVMSALGTIKSQQNLDANGLSNVIRQEQEKIAGSVGGKSPASMLDLDNDGSIMDEVTNIGGALVNSGLLGKLF